MAHFLGKGRPAILDGEQGTGVEQAGPVHRQSSGHSSSEAGSVGS